MGSLQPGSLFEEDRRLIEMWLQRSLELDSEVPSRLAEAMRYAVLGSGKRVRSLLCLHAYRAARLQDERIMSEVTQQEQSEIAPFCCGIEMIHAFSLAHDDLPSMDDDDLRRGKPSLHRQFDEATAILAADALFAYAFEEFARSGVAAECKLAAINEIAVAVGPRGMAGGQMLDIMIERRQSNQSRRQLNRIQEMKTAKFIAASIVCGAIVAGAPVRILKKLRSAGLALGRLFQITDDLLDVSEDGKANLARTLSKTRVRRYAERVAGQAECAFRSLGSSYVLLSKWPQIILNRQT